MASCVFLGDVFIRRVQVHFAWLPLLLVCLRDFILRRQPTPDLPQYIERLKSRKAEVAEHLEQLRAAARFELPTQAPVDLKSFDELERVPPTASEPRATETSPAKAEAGKEEETYTERLLKAKKKAWEERH